MVQTLFPTFTPLLVESLVCESTNKTNPTERTYYNGAFVYTQTGSNASSLSYIITPEGRLVNSGTIYVPIWSWEYNLKDHLGNVRTVISPNATRAGYSDVLQQTNYFPFGMKMTQLSTTTGSTNDYLYNGKQLQDDFGLNWYDYGARFYDPALGRFHSVDPLAEEAYGWSPYRYGFNNPIIFTDPTGMLEDWVQNDKTQEYEWKDDVTSEDNTPKGYTYIGSEDKDILTDLNLPVDAAPQSVSKTGASLEGNDGIGGGIALVRTKTEAEGSIKVSALVSIKAENITDNNKLGRKFEGVKVEATFVQTSKSGDSNLKMSYNGLLSVQYGSDSGVSMLKSPTGSYVYPTGSTVSNANLVIPASIANKNKSFSATIGAGTTSTGLFYRPKPIKLNWNNN